jgi:hypothetical protein
MMRDKGDVFDKHFEVLLAIARVTFITINAEL